MRIISGTLRGKTITPPSSYDARPTTDFAREALFDILSNEYEFEGLCVLDLFSGTGAISYEFISRGAEHCWAVEMNPRNASFISTAAKNLGIGDRVSVVRHNVFDFLGLCSRKFDLVFADPPYALSGLETLPDRVFECDVIHPGGYFILEHGPDKSFAGHRYFVKERKYGKVHFSFFEKPQDSESGDDGKSGE